jgi:hypothetical protein
MTRRENWGRESLPTESKEVELRHPQSQFLDKQKV